MQVTVIWWVSAEHIGPASMPAENDKSGRFFGGRWFPREGRISDAELQALRCSLKFQECATIAVCNV